jgi:hypothetical protein
MTKEKSRCFIRLRHSVLVRVSILKTSNDDKKAVNLSLFYKVPFEGVGFYGS